MKQDVAGAKREHACASAVRKQVEDYFFGNPQAISNKILFIKRDNRLSEYKEHLSSIREFGNVWHGLTGSLYGERISIIVTGIGPSLVGDAVYALDRPGAVCLYSGTCGGLADDLSIGDYVAASQAVCADGFSFHLGRTPLSVVAGDAILLDALVRLLDAKVTRVERGRVFTTASVVREIELDFWAVVDEECRAIEMGASAFYTAARATSKRAAAYYWVTDLPRRKSFFDPIEPEDVRVKQERYNRAVSLDLEILASL